MRQAGSANPLMLLDEIDKVSADYRGDTASALLEVLDGEQNVKFRDHYVEIPLDLSNVLFIATANTTQTIPGPLLDRMELIEVSSYTENEKFHIAKKYLVPKQLERNGLTSEELTISDKALEKIIHNYTREAGVRNLERRIGEICRKAAREFLEKKRTAVRVTETSLEKYLGLKQGSVSPFGLMNDTDHQVEFFIDKDLSRCKSLGIHPLENTATVFLSYKDLDKFLWDLDVDVIKIKL